MSHDVFEDELRTLLRGATEAENPAFHDIDTTEVLGSGRRVVRRRRMAAAGAALAAVTVVGIGSWAALDGSSDRALEVPATRTSAPASGIVEVALPGPEGATYAVRFDRATGSAVTVLRADGRTTTTLVGRGMRQGQGAAWGTVSQKPFVALGVVPDDSTQMMTRLSGGDLGGTSTNDASLPGTGFKAFVITSEKSPGGAELTGLDYAVGDRVFAADGTEVPSATVGDHTLYVDEAADEIGLVEPDGSATRPLSASSAGGVPHIATSRGATGSALVTTTAVVLPIGAQDVKVQVADGSTLRSSDTTPLLGGSGLAVVAVVEGPEPTSKAVAEVTWSVDGRPASWTPRD